MSDHAPESLTGSERLIRWIIEATDLRLSVCMLLLAIVVGTAFLLIDRLIF